MKRSFDFFKYIRSRSAVLLISATLLITVLVGTTVALIIVKTDTAGNTFDPPIVRISLEGYDSITNTGNVPVYVRSVGIATWVSEDDENVILSEAPKLGEDFTIDSITEGWFQASDEFYYYKEILNPGETVELFTSAIQQTEKDGYELHLQLISGSIQAFPANAVEESWPYVEVDANNCLVEKDGYTR